MKKITLIIIFSVITVFVSAQNLFKGNLIYESSKPTVDLKGNTNNSVSDKIVVNISENFIRIEYFYPATKGFENSNATIINLNDKSTIKLFNSHYGKYAIKFTKEKTDSLKAIAKNSQYIESIKYTDKTTKILKYKSNKADVIYNDGKKENLYFTSDILVPKEINEYFGYDKIGEKLLLKKIFLNENIENTIEILSVEDFSKSAQKHDDNLFIIPNDYKILDSFDAYLDATNGKTK